MNRCSDMTSNSSSTTRLAVDRNQSRRHSGLSALIQAANAQFGHRFEADNNDDNGKPEHGHSIGHTGLAGPYTHAPSSYEALYNQHQRFPEQLMTLANDPKNEDIITFLPDGKFVAIRAEEFAAELMGQCFAVSAFDAFLELAHDWGYSCISDRDCDIQVMRHPLFIQGNWEKCSHIKFGESPTNARLSALPARIKLDFAIDDAANSLAAGKRRLSPGFIARRDSESSSASQRLKTRPLGSEIDGGEPQDCEQEVAGVSDNPTPSASKSYTSNSRHDELRSIALAITTSELKLTSSGSETVSVSSSSPLQQHYRSPLIESAVESATHTIMTDAIETLLRDKTHTQRTYLKHERELSRSSLPGVVSLSKQLFSPCPAPATDPAPLVPEPTGTVSRATTHLKSPRKPRSNSL